MSFTKTQKRRLTKLADHLETAVEPEHFDMSNWFKAHRPNLPPNIFVGSEEDMLRLYDAEEIGDVVQRFDTPEEATANCGTVACVAGHGAALFKLRPQKNAWGSNREWGDIVGDHLGLDPYTRDELFIPSGLSDRSRTPKLAAKAVRALRDTGEVPEWWRMGSYDINDSGHTREELANA